MAVFMFLLAGTTDYPQGIAFSIAMFIIVFIQMYVLRDKTDMVEERMHPGKGIKLWDKFILGTYGAMIIFVIIIAPIDIGRYHWSPRFPLIFYILSYILFIVANILFIWSMYINRWFSSMVRIQKDRRQKVVQDGPYKHVRHPGYVGGILLGISIALTLGSSIALIPACLGAIVLIIRTYLEDRTLQKELPGYKAYTMKTQYRLLPGVW